MRAVRIACTAGLIALAWWQVDLTVVLDALAGAEPLPALAAFWALLAGQLISGLRWRGIAMRYGLHGSPAWFTTAYLRGCFYNAVLPTGIGGDANRVLLARRLGTATAAARSVVVDRCAGLAALAVTTMALVPLTPYGGGRVVGVTLAIVALLLATAALWHRPLWGWLALTAAYELVWFAGVWLLAVALDVDVPPLAVPAVLLVAGIAIALPISIGGTGAREGAFVLALAPLGIAAPAAVALGAAFGIALTLVGLCGALVPIGRWST